MNLQLSLKKKWFEMTKQGIKSEDYREVNGYWLKRLLENDIKSGFEEMVLFDYVQYCLENNWQPLFKPFTINTMTLGYPKSTDTSRIIKYEHAGIEIRTGNTEWGAEPNKLYFVIKHGKIIK